MGADENKYAGEGPMHKFKNFLVGIIEKPVIWFRESVVEPNHQTYYWYHEKIQRVPTVDECYVDDDVCVYEANEQFLRDKMVEKFIVDILRKRYYHCALVNITDQEECKELKDDWTTASTNFFIKYGELGVKNHVIGCYMKQKHRLAWERRHGPVGTGKAPEADEVIKKEE